MTKFTQTLITITNATKFCVQTLTAKGYITPAEIRAFFAADFAGASHAASHATGGADEVTPASIGAAETDHEHVSADISDASAGGNGAGDAHKVTKFGASGEIQTDSMYARNVYGRKNSMAPPDAPAFPFGMKASLTGSGDCFLPVTGGNIALTSQADGSITSADISDATTDGNLNPDALLKSDPSGNLSLNELRIGSLRNANGDLLTPPGSAGQLALTTDVDNAKAYADTLVTGLLDDRGNFDASVNTFPTTGGSGGAGAILKGDLWTISVVATSGPLEGYGVSCVLRALVDTPGQTVENWAINAVGYGYTPENVVNKSSDVAADFESLVKYPTVKAIVDWVQAIRNWAGNHIFSGNLSVSGLFGVGTNSPLTKLEVADGTLHLNGAKSNTPNLSSWGNVGVTYLVVGKNAYWGIRQGTNESFHLDTYNGGAYYTPLSILQDGKVGLGVTNPLSPLHIAAAGHVSLIVDSTTGQDSQFQFRVGGSLKTLMGAGNGGTRIYDNQLDDNLFYSPFNSGKVGIRTTDPQSTFEVNGTFGITGSGTWNGATFTGAQHFADSALPTSDATDAPETNSLITLDAAREYLIKSPTVNHWREDFVQTPGQVGTLAWWNELEGAGAGLSYPTASFPQIGVVRLASGTENLKGNCVYRIPVITLLTNPQWEACFIVKTEQTTNCDLVVGFTSNGGTAGLYGSYGGPSFGVRYSSARDTNFMFFSKNTNADYAANDANNYELSTGIAADTAFHNIGIRSLTAGVLQMRIDGGAWVTIAHVNNAGSGYYPLIMVLARATSQQYIQADFASFLQTGIAR